MPLVYTIQSDRRGRRIYGLSRCFVGAGLLKGRLPWRYDVVPSYAKSHEKEEKKYVRSQMEPWWAQDWIYNGRNNDSVTDQFICLIHEPSVGYFGGVYVGISIVYPI